jgi:hypothetical protein
MVNRVLAWMRGGSTGLRLPWRMFWVGLVVRVLYITLAHTYRIRPYQDHFQFAWEVGRIARALATGYGFADPFVGHTGPTAWSPPLYPLLLAGVFKLFGVYTPLSAWVILTLNSIFSAAIAPAVYEIASCCYDAYGYGKRVALWSGWLWALYPAAIQYAVHWVWEMSLTTCLFAWILVIALRVRGIGDQASQIDCQIDRQADPQTNTRWALFGILWALICMSNSSLLLFLPACSLWMLFGGSSPIRTAIKNLPKAALAGALFCLCLSPWVYRNWTVFHAFIPTRGNLGAELYQSMLPEHQAFPWGTTIPYVENHPEYMAYKTMGEVAYVKQKNELGNDLIRTHHTRFVQYALKRFYFFWVSVPHPIEKGWFLEIVREMDFCFLSISGIFGLLLSLKRRVPGAWLFAWVFLLAPLAYYFITVQARFRHPLEPIITILTVFLFQSATTRRDQQSHTSSQPVAAGEFSR